MNGHLICSVLLFSLAGCAAESGSAIPNFSTEASPPGTASSDSATAAANENRHIIYRATLSLDVKSFAKTSKEVESLTKKAGGYIAQYREDSASGVPRGGHWTVRVPTDRFEDFVESVAALGVTHHREITSEDVTEEFVDLTARLKNKKELEKRLLEMVAGRGDEIKDLLALEAELSRVREEIERMEGRMRYLADRVAMTTVQISAYEREVYQPPLAATFSGRVAQSFYDSLNLLRQFGEGCVIVAAALLPWAALSSILLAILITIIRMLGRRRKAQPMNATVV